MDLLIVGTAGFLGSIIRYALYQLESSIQNPDFPYATLFINLTGCFVAGLLFGMSGKIAPENKHYITLILVGFVGSYTTFSTFSAESLHLLETDSVVKFSLNILANVFGGVLMVWAGKIIT